jgi:DNA-binding transcriptional MerR regulator
MRSNKPASSELIKLYYRIGEVARLVGVQPHVLRYWESEFRSIRPQKSSRGQRVYSRRDVEKLLLIKDLLKHQGFTIAGAKRRLREAQPAPIDDVTELSHEGEAEKSAHFPDLKFEPAPAEPLASNDVDSTEPIASPQPHPGKAMRKALLQLRRQLITLERLFAPDVAPRAAGEQVIVSEQHVAARQSDSGHVPRSVEPGVDGRPDTGAASKR